MPLDLAPQAAQAIRYDAGGHFCDGLLIAGAPDQLVVVLPDWRGCTTDYAARRGQDLSRATGATICVTDAYGAGKQPAAYAGDAEHWIDKALSDPAALRKAMAAQIRGLVSHLGTTHEHVSIVGYCLGGALAFEAGRAAIGLDAVVSVHGIPSSRSPITSAPGNTAFLAIHGADDPIIGQEHLRAFEAEMVAAGADWQSHSIGGARHGFTSEEADPKGSHQRYDPRAAARALALTQAFLETAVPVA